MTPGYENKFIMRMHTEATAKLSINDASSWTIRRGEGVLQNVAITKISNPLAQVKSASADVPCVNGTVDLTERYGQVFYKNKTVEVEIQKKAAGRDDWAAMRDAFAKMHGRVVDFAFATASTVEWYYTGRLSVEGENEPSAKLTLKFDTYPFMKSVLRRSYQIPTATLIDRASNGWSVSTKPSTTRVSLGSGIIKIWGAVGDKVILRRSAANANRYAIAVSSLMGGDYQFGNGSRTLGVPSGGNLYLEITLDGSYYDWDDQDASGSKVYKPCFYLHSMLTQLSVSGGQPTGADGNKNTNPRCAVVLPSNVRIRPELVNMNTGGAIVLLDGERVDIPENSEETLFPEAVLPGIRADRSGEDTVCILSACGLSSNDSPSVQIVYREEVLG